MGEVMKNRQQVPAWRAVKFIPVQQLSKQQSTLYLTRCPQKWFKSTKSRENLEKNLKQAWRTCTFQLSLVADRSEACVWRKDTSDSFSGDNWARVFMSGARSAAGIVKEIYSNEVGWEIRCRLAQRGLGLQFALRNACYVAPACCLAPKCWLPI